MKVLYYDWDSLAQLDMIDGFQKYGMDVILTTYHCTNYEKDPIFEQTLSNELENGNFDFVFSFNYFPPISRVCEQRNTPYLSWVFDSPHLSIFSDTLKNSCNVLFHFDGYYCEMLQNQGYANVHHLPLAANVDRLDKIIQDDENKKYQTDLSYVGSLYDKKNLYDDIQYLPNYLKGYFEGVMQSQQLIHGYNFMHELLTDDVMKELKKYVKIHTGQSFFFDEAFVFFNNFLCQKVTSMERIQILDTLSKSIDIALYSNSGNDFLPGVRHMGCIDSEVTAPKVYHYSKVNLNITLRSILTGIPLRVFDILGSGGFLISNYQEELYRLFQPDEDVIIYESLEDLKQKVAYYLSHDAKRTDIALCAHQKIKENHTFDKRIQTMLKTLS